MCSHFFYGSLKMMSWGRNNDHPQRMPEPRTFLALQDAQALRRRSSDAILQQYQTDCKGAAETVVSQWKHDDLEPRTGGESLPVCRGSGTYTDSGKFYQRLRQRLTPMDA